MDILHWFTEEHIRELMKQLGFFGIFLAVFLPFIEAFLPFLPIFLFAVVNVNAYGFVLGFLLTWIGTVLGCYLVFLLVRKYGQSRFLKHLEDHKHVKSFMVRFEKEGAVPLFVLLCFPFTPASIINIVAAMSSITKRAFLLILVLSKSIMLLIVSLIGSDIDDFYKQPLKSIILVAVLIVFWLVGKWVENYYRSDHQKVGKK